MPEAAARHGDRLWIAAAAPYVPVLVTVAGVLPPIAVAETLNARMSDEEWNDLLDDVASDATNAQLDTLPSLPFVDRVLARFPAWRALPDGYLLEVVDHLLAFVDDDASESESESGNDKSSSGPGEGRS